MFLAVLAPGMLSADSPFSEQALDLQNRIKTSAAETAESIEQLKKTTNAVTGKYVAIDIGPFTLTILIPEDKFPQFSIGVTGATKTTSISTAGDVCDGQSVKGGGGLYGTATVSKCHNLVHKNDKTVSVAAGVGIGAGADAASLALTAGGFVKVPFDLKQLIKHSLSPKN